jgi:hypothetical protein
VGGKTGITTPVVSRSAVRGEAVTHLYGKGSEFRAMANLGYNRAFPRKKLDFGAHSVPWPGTRLKTFSSCRGGIDLWLRCLYSQALPGFASTTGLSATPNGPASPSRASG